MPGSSVLGQYLDWPQPAVGSAANFWLFFGLGPPKKKFIDDIVVPKAR